MSARAVELHCGHTVDSPYEPTFDYIVRYDCSSCGVKDQTASHVRHDPDGTKWARWSGDTWVRFHDFPGHLIWDPDDLAFRADNPQSAPLLSLDAMCDAEDRNAQIAQAAAAYVNARREFESNQPQLRYAKKRVNELYARLAALIPEGE
jgi:hypothetical protein